MVSGEEMIAVPPLELLRKIETVERSVDRKMKYRPCLVTLRNCRTVDLVYVQEVGDYSMLLGRVANGRRAQADCRFSRRRGGYRSPSRFPAGIANRIYRAGESGMGYYVFTLVFGDRSEVPCFTGDAVDFVKLPPILTRVTL